MGKLNLIFARRTFRLILPLMQNQYSSISKHVAELNPINTLSPSSFWLVCLQLFLPFAEQQPPQLQKDSTTQSCRNDL